MQRPVAVSLKVAGLQVIGRPRTCLCRMAKLAVELDGPDVGSQRFLSSWSRESTSLEAIRVGGGRSPARFRNGGDATAPQGVGMGNPVAPAPEGGQHIQLTANQKPFLQRHSASFVTIGSKLKFRDHAHEHALAVLQLIEHMKVDGLWCIDDQQAPDFGLRD